MEPDEVGLCRTGIPQGNIAVLCYRSGWERPTAAGGTRKIRVCGVDHTGIRM